MRSRFSRLAVSFCALTALFAAAPAIDPKLYLDDVKYLASPELKGRDSGSPELEKAAAYIAGKFREFGLKPADGKDYYQAFTLTTAAKPGPDNRLTAKENGRTESLPFQKDYTGFSF